MGNWWLWPRDRARYMKWVIKVTKGDLDHIEEVFEEIRKRDRKYKEQRQKKREEEEEAQEVRIPVALTQYIRDNDRVPGARYRSIARKYRIEMLCPRRMVRHCPVLWAETRGGAIPK